MFGRGRSASVTYPAEQWEDAILAIEAEAAGGLREALHKILRVLGPSPHLHEPGYCEGCGYEIMAALSVARAALAAIEEKPVERISGYVNPDGTGEGNWSAIEEKP